MSVVGAIMVPHPPIILPEVGRGEEKKIAASDAAYRRAAAFAAELKPDTIVLSSPHAILYADYFHVSPGKSARGDMGQFRAPQLRVRATTTRSRRRSPNWPSARASRRAPLGSGARRSTTGR